MMKFHGLADQAALCYRSLPGLVRSQLLLGAGADGMLYRLTNEQKYLDFAAYIIEEGGKADLQLEFAMPLRLHLPEHWEEDLVYNDAYRDETGHYVAHPQKVTHLEEEDHYVAVTRGPLTLAADSRTGKPADSVFAPAYNATICKETEIVSGVSCAVKLECTAKDGEKFYLVDYASAAVIGRPSSPPGCRRNKKAPLLGCCR